MVKEARHTVPNRLLRRQRERRHWTQTDLAGMLDTTYLSVCRWEQGTTTPSLHFRKRLCELFGLPPEELGLASATMEALPEGQAAFPPPPRGRGPEHPLSPASLSSRCQPPHLRAAVLPRPRVLHTIQAALESSPVVLLSAPAGWGKTTMLSAFLKRSPELPAAWLTLADEDNDPLCLLQGLVAALQRLHPCCGATTLSLLTHPDTDVRRLLNVLLSEGEDLLPDGGVLVLDELHVLTHPAAQHVVQTLVQALPPPLRLLIATRSAPPFGLARLRAQRLVQEIRLDDLRFTEQEVQALLSTTLGWTLAPAHLRLLCACTGGWAAGLDLLVSSLQRLPQASQKTTLLTHLARVQRCICDVCAEEGCEHQEFSLHPFLFHTGLLNALPSTFSSQWTGDPDAFAHPGRVSGRQRRVPADEQEDFQHTSHAHNGYSPTNR